MNVKVILLGMTVTLVTATACAEDFVPSSRAYVFNGLVAQYDGIENAGRGIHAESPDDWVNLIGDVSEATDMEYGHTSDGSDPSWGSNYLQLSGSAGLKNWSHGSSDLFRQAIVDRAATADYCFSGGWNSPFYAGKGTRMILNQSLAGGYLGLLVSHAAVPESNTLPQPDTNLKSFTVRVSDVASMFTNGVTYLASGTITMSKPTGEPDFWLGISPQYTSVDGTGTSWWGCGGKYYSLRLYTRALTDAEIAWNHAVDKVRFMGGTWSGRGLSVSAEPAEFGTPSPAYGAGFTNSASQSFSIDLTPIVYDDGVSALPSRDGVRGFYADVIVQDGMSDPVTNAVTSFQLELADDSITYVTWRFTNVQCRVVASVVEKDRESATVNGVVVCTNWTTYGATTRLVAASSVGAPFETWLGDTNGIADVTSTTVDVPADGPRALQAKFGAIVIGWSYDSTAKTITDGNWLISVAEVTGGLGITTVLAGEGELDLTDFESESGCGKKIVRIQSNAKLGTNTTVTAVIAPDVTYVGSNGFGCWSGGTNQGKIERIVLSSALSTIGDWAFYKQTGLTSFCPMTVTNVTTLGSTYGKTFTDCTKLPGRLSFTAMTKVYGYQNFSGCKAIQEIHLPLYTTPQRYEFNNCSALTNLTLSPETTFLGYGMCKDCSKLTCLSPTNFTSVTSCGESTDYGVFQGCSALALPLAFPQLAVIPKQMFQNCTALPSVSIPAATSVGEKAFYTVKPGMTIDFGKAEAPTFGANAIYAKTAPLVRCLTHNGANKSSWRALTDPNAGTFATYKDVYPGVRAFGLLSFGSYYCWAIDTSKGLLIFFR